MPEELENVDLEATLDSGEPASAAEDRVAEEMTGRGQERSAPNPALEAAIEAKVLARIGMDPDIRRVLDAKASRKPFRIVGEDELVAPPKAEPTEEELDSMSPAKLASYMISKLEGSVGKIVEKRLEPVIGELSQVRARGQQSEAEKIQAEVDKVRTAYKDFDLFTNEMLDLSNKTGGTLSVEELYLLSRRRKGGGKPAQRTESERPSQETSRPREKVDGPVLGRNGFNNLLSKSLSKLKFDSREE